MNRVLNAVAHRPGATALVAIYLLVAVSVHSVASITLAALLLLASAVRLRLGNRHARTRPRYGA